MASLTDPLIDTTVVENLVARLLITGSDKVEPEIRVLFADEPVPSSLPDSTGDTPINRWCKMGHPRMLPMERRSGSGDHDTQRFVMAITVGVSDAHGASAPARLNQVAHLVCAALDGAHEAHATTTHDIQIQRAGRDTQAGGEHEGHKVGVVTIAGLASRTSGRTASLTTA